MIKELVQDYIYVMNKNEDLSASSFKVLVSLLQKSESSGWSPVVRMSSKKISEDARIGTTTVASSLESLMFSGAISVESKNGAEKSITILFINDVISSSEFSGKTNESVKSVIKRHLNLDEDREKLIVIQNKKETEEENEVFDFIRESGKNSVELSEYTKSKGVHILAQSKSEYNEFRAGNFSLLRFMPVGRVLASVRKVLRFERLKSKKVTVAKETLSISVKALLPANSLSLNDLENPSKSELKEYADFLQISPLLYSSVLLLLCLLDRVFLQRRIYKKITNTTYVDKRKKTSPKKNYNSFTLNEETIKELKKDFPDLLNVSETIYGEQITFLKALQNWIDYKEASGEKINKFQMKAKIGELSTSNNPVGWIMRSISDGWKNIATKELYGDSNESNKGGYNDDRCPVTGIRKNQTPQWIINKGIKENRRKAAEQRKMIEDLG